MHNEILKDLRAAYDARAAERDGVVISPWKSEERERFVTELKREGKTRLLEIGSGPGRDGKFFADHGFSVVCTDLSPEMVSLCRKKGLEARVMDFMHLDFPKRGFDAVFALNCLLHVPKKNFESVLETIHALLRPSGLFYLGQYGGEDVEGPWPEDSYEPKRFFSFHTDEQILEKVENLFDLVHFRRIELEKPGPVHFQSMILRARSEPAQAMDG